MTYEERLAALGITNRGKLAGSFDDPSQSVGIGRESEYVNPKAGMRIKRPELTEDLSHLNDPRWRRSKETGHAGGRVAAERGASSGGGNHKGTKHWRRG